MKGQRVPIEEQKENKASAQRKRIAEKRALGIRVSSRKLIDPEQKKINLIERAKKQLEWSHSPEGKEHFKKLHDNSRKYATVAEYKKYWAEKRSIGIKTDLLLSMKDRLCALRHRAKKNGFPFDIDIDDLMAAYNPVCPYLGIALRIDAKRNSGESLSVDKIDPTKGYVKGNIEIISMKANKMKDNATGEELVKFANRVLVVFAPELSGLE